MKKLYITAVFLLFIAVGAMAQKVNSGNFEYAEGVEFSVLRFNNSKMSEDNNTAYFAKGGLLYKTAIIEINNSTKSDVEIDFEKFHLLDSKNTRYDVHTVVQNMKLTFSTYKYKMTLKAGKTKKYMVEFWPPYPQSEQVKQIVVNEDIFRL